MTTKRQRRKKLGRNDPCPCGSGKKYKKCCLSKESKPPAGQQREKSKEPKDPLKFVENIIQDVFQPQKERDPFWTKFENGTLEEKVALCQAELEKDIQFEPFDMIESIRREAWIQNDLSSLNSLLRFFQTNNPLFYQEDGSYYNYWLMEINFATENYDDLPMALDFYRRHPDKDIDTYFKVIDLFCYYGQTEDLISVMTATYPQISTSKNIIGSGIVEFFEILIFLNVHKLVETKSSLTEQDLQDLFDHLEKLDEINTEEIKIIVSWLSGQTSRGWKAEDFDKSTKKQDWDKNFYLLSFDFLRYLHINHQIPLSKGELVRQEILSCWYEQRRFQTRKDEASILYPRASELDRSLGRLVNFFNPRLIRLSCVFEYLPHLVHFLVERGLIYEHHTEKVIKGLQKLQNSTIQYLSKHPFGRSLISAIKENWVGYS